MLLAHAVTTRLSFEPLQLVPLALVTALYATRVRRLRARGIATPSWRIVLFGTGFVLMLVALVSPLATWGEDELFSMHMAQHVILGDLAPLCFLAGLTGPILRPVLALKTVERLRVLAHPFVALPLWALGLYAWHLPFLYGAAIHHESVHALEHASFFLGGTLMWAPVVELLPGPAWFGTGAKLGYIVLVRLIETVLANVFFWSSTAFYSQYVHPWRPWGIKPIEDQNIAGAVMMLEGSLVTLGALAWLFLRLGAESELRQRLLEQGLDPRAVNRAVRYGRGQELAPPR
jgi:cytochrome c oxidase assembly factor CtaG